jgi:hypothetical protein
MFTETPWDDEVDVLCIGTEGGVLAAGIAAASAGLDVYLGITEPTDGDADLAASLSYGGGDTATTKHLAGFDYAFGKKKSATTRWPVRTVEDIPPTPRARNRGSIEPFFGAALEQWAHRCAAAPNSVLYDRVRDRQMTEMRCSAQGEKIEAAVVGSLHLSPDLPAVSLITWLKSRAVTVGLQPHTGVRLVRLIFEYGLVGALLDTPGGVTAVRANNNLIIGVGDPVTMRTQPLISGTVPMTARVCLVSKAASRFGELEIVTAAGDEHDLSFVDEPGGRTRARGERALNYRGVRTTTIG